VEGAGERYFDDSPRGGDGIRSRFVLAVDNDAAPATKQVAEQLAHSQGSLSCDCGLATT